VRSTGATVWTGMSGDRESNKASQTQLERERKGKKSEKRAERKDERRLKSRWRARRRRRHKGMRAFQQILL